MKPNILFGAATFNLAETTRMIETAKACAVDFEPHFCGYGGRFASLITEAGYLFHLLQPELTEEKIEYLWQVDRMEAYGQPFTVAELTQRVESELALYRALAPRAVVMGSLLSAPISARVARIPLVNVVPFPLTRAYLQAGLPALPNVTERPGMPRLLGRVANRLINGFLLYVPVLTKNFNIVAKRYGLAPFPSFFGVWEGDYNLVADVPLLAGVDAQALPPFWQYVGPIFAHLDEPVPPAVARLAEQRARPLIYFAMGSSGNRAVVKQVLASFAGMDVDAVAPIKGLLADEDVAAPENVLVTDYLPALEVNRMADLAVIHGGQGTVQTACMAGRPFVGVGMQPEQEINIEFVVRWDGPENVAAFLKEQFSAPEPPAVYEPMQNLAGQRIAWRRWLVGAAALGLALLLWRGQRRRRGGA